MCDQLDLACTKYVGMMATCQLLPHLQMTTDFTNAVLQLRARRLLSANEMAAFLQQPPLKEEHFSIVFYLV